MHKGDETMKVKSNLRYKDLVLKRMVEKDEIIEVDKERAKVLTSTKHNGNPFCSFVEEPKPKRGRPKKA